MGNEWSILSEPHPLPYGMVQCMQCGCSLEDSTASGPAQGAVLAKGMGGSTTVHMCLGSRGE